jgi:hypothetical protein
MKKISTLIILILLLSAKSYAQGVAVNTDGSTADASALLDIKSTAKGVLVPRMAQSDRNLITSPATGLMIYQTDNIPGFYYNAGTPGTPNWTSLKLANGSATGQIYLTGGSPFSPQAPQTVTGDVTISSTAVTQLANVTTANIVGSATRIPILSIDSKGRITSASEVAASNGLPTATSAGQILITGSSPFLPAYQSVSGDVTLAASGVTSYNNIVPIAKGGTGTGTTPSLVAGSNVTITGAWPNQTINASASGGSFPSITTAPAALTSIVTTSAYQTMKSITFPSTGYYLVSAFVNIISQQTSDEYHLKFIQGANTIAGNTDYYSIDGLLSASTVVNVTSVVTPVVIECSNGGNGSGTAVGTYSVVKLSN